MLRDYQAKALDDVRAAYRAGHRSVVLVAPTGAGKTVIAADAIRSARARGRRVLVVVPRVEILGQTVARLDDPTIVAAGHDRKGDPGLIVAMAQTLARRGSDIGEVDLIIVDEAHLALAETYARILERWPNAHRLLLTATPCRTDGRGLGEIATALVEVASVRGLVEAGHLVSPVVYSAQVPDLAGVRRGASGELAPGEAGARYQKTVILADTIEQIQMRCAGRRVLVFASSVEHSRAIVEQLGDRARHIDGQSRDRAEVLAAFADGKIDVVVNYGCLTEGLDVPAIDAIVVARSTQSEALWRQMIGRGLRPHAGKTDCIIIDQGGNAYRHGHPLAVRPWTLAGRTVNADEAPPSLRTCPDCLAIYEPAPTCPRCGAEAPVEPRKPPKVLSKAELSLVEPDADGKLIELRDPPEWLDASRLDEWYFTERERIRRGFHWRWSWHRMADEDPAVRRVVHAFAGKRMAFRPSW